MAVIDVSSFTSYLQEKQHSLASQVQWSIPTVISNGRIASVVFNEKLNDAKVSLPACEQVTVISLFSSMRYLHHNLPLIPVCV